MKPKQAMRKFRQAGVEVEPGRGKGGHYMIRYEGKWATFPVHGDRDIGPDFIKKLCRQLGLDWRKVL
jgi:predicted RNA binding protein YcfA (HicA-like mRNA interferase family)